MWVPSFDRYPVPLPVGLPQRSTGSSPPVCNLLGHIKGHRRLLDHSQSAAWLAHAQWMASFEAARSHSRNLKLNMPALGTGQEAVFVAADLFFCTKALGWVDICANWMRVFPHPIRMTCDCAWLAMEPVYTCSGQLRSPFQGGPVRLWVRFRCEFRLKFGIDLHLNW